MEPEDMATDAPVWVSIGEFRVAGVGQLRAYLPERWDETDIPGPSADSARYNIVHPVSQGGIAMVTGLDAEKPVWEHAPDEWTAQQKSEAVEKTRQLKKYARGSHQRHRDHHEAGEAT
jgi:hypothetical protein